MNFRKFKNGDLISCLTIKWNKMQSYWNVARQESSTEFLSSPFYTDYEIQNRVVSIVVLDLCHVLLIFKEFV
jgi:hypothetical protein